MIKRLTDEPTTLAAARPDLTFPPGLQPVLDTALARTPTERYQSVTKFAADIAAITGRPDGAAVPHTRAGIADTEGKTQLLDTTGGATQRISAKRPPPTAPSATVGRKRSLIPVAVGVVVLLAGGGAWVAFGGGKNANGNHPDSTAVPHDTAGNQGNRQSGGLTTLGARETGRRAATPPAVPPASSHINLARAKDALDDLFLEKLTPTTAAMVRDSALVFYTAAGISEKDKAYSAFVAGQAYFQLHDRTAGCRYIRTANQLDPADNTYSTLLGQCS